MKETMFAFIHGHGGAGGGVVVLVLILLAAGLVLGAAGNSKSN